jgi:hypothetical protein
MLLFLFLQLSFASEDKAFYLKQVDYRHRTKISFNLPKLLRIRVRPSLEYRYKNKKKQKSKQNTESAKTLKRNASLE